MRADIRVLVVDDDPLFRESLGQNLIDSGFEVVDFDNGPAALEFFQEGTYADLMLLDWKMPSMNGIEVLRRMRQTGVEIPVIFLTVLSDQIYEEAALLHGAVDFVEKSRSFSILLKRIELIVGGSKGPSDLPAGKGNGAAVRFGDLELDREGSRAFWQGRQVPLTLNEFEIVRYLAERAGRDVHYRELYDLVHGEGFVAGTGDEGYRANVRTFIKRIRQKFRDLDESFGEIENYPGFGYRWRQNAEGAS